MDERLCVPFKLIRRTLPRKGLPIFSARELVLTSSLIDLSVHRAAGDFGHHSLHRRVPCPSADVAPVRRSLQSTAARSPPHRRAAASRPSRMAISASSLSRDRRRPPSELLDRIPPLFDQRRDHLLRFRIVQPASALDFAVHERGLGHPQRPRRTWSFARIAASASAEILSMKAMLPPI